MGGLKRKIPLEKIEKKESRAVAFSKRSKGLYSKAAELCLMSDAQIAIIATPVSSKSNVSFYSFGHSSVDSVVAAFLSNQRPMDDLGLGFWWEDEKLAKSENSEELSEAISSMSKMLKSLKQLQHDRCDDKKMKKIVLHGTDNNTQTLNLQSSPASLCVQDDVSIITPKQNPSLESEVVEDGELMMIYNNLNEVVPNLSDLDEHNNNNALLENMGEYDQFLEFDSNIDFETSYESFLKSLEMNVDDMKMKKSILPKTDNNTQTLNLPSSSTSQDNVSIITPNQNLCLDSEVVEDGELMIYKDGVCDQDLDFDSIIDFKTNSESLLKSLEMRKQNLCCDYKDEAVVIHRDLDQDNIRFSDYFKYGGA